MYDNISSFPLFGVYAACRMHITGTHTVTVKGEQGRAGQTGRVVLIDRPAAEELCDKGNTTAIKGSFNYIYVK